MNEYHRRERIKRMPQQRKGRRFTNEEHRIREDSKESKESKDVASKGTADLPDIPMEALD